MASPLRVFWIVVLVFQIAMIAIYSGTVDYRDDLHGKLVNNTKVGDVGTTYAYFQDVHVMIFVGFGFLVVFLNRYGQAAVSFNYMLAVLATQWALLTNGFFHQINEDGGWKSIKLELTDLITADFATAAVLITFGSVLGKVSPLQLFLIMFFELIFYSMNEWLCVLELKAVDVGGSMIIHAFGAFFGVACSLAISRQHEHLWQCTNRISSTPTSNTTAMVGTLFLWLFWPSFNGALAEGAAQHRVIINTVLSLSASATAAFIFSAVLRPGRKFDMEDILNASLAGGVAIGGSADLVMQPFGALLVGFVAGTTSVAGYAFLQPYLQEKIKLHDTAGVLHLHGLPGVIGGLASVVAAARAHTDEFGPSLVQIFAARDPNGDDRTAAEQARYQLAALGVTLAISVTSGYLVGLFVSLPFALPPKRGFVESDYFETEFTDEEYEAHERERLAQRASFQLSAVHTV